MMTTNGHVYVCQCAECRDRRERRTRWLGIAFVVWAVLIILPWVIVLAHAQDAAAPAATLGPTAVPTAQINTTGPVTSETTISVGTVVGQIMLVIWTAFGGVMIWYGSIVLQKMAAHFNIQITEAQRAEYADHLLHAINLMAPRAAAELSGKGQVAVKNATIAYAVNYMRDHHDELGKAIGIDARSSDGNERIKAQAQTAINDPSVPTPKVLDPPQAGPII